MDVMTKRYGVLGALVTLAFLCGVFAPSTRAQFDSLPTVVRGAPHWTIANDPAVNTAATISKAAGTGGAVHVADCVTATFVANTTAPAASSSPPSFGMVRQGQARSSGLLILA
jgi:hypothetical protein